MTPNLASRITGTGSAFPAQVLTNDELSARLRGGSLPSSPGAIDSAWIAERTGVSERRISDPSNPKETNSGLALSATIRALEAAGCRPDELDGIVYGTCTPDTLIPSSACWLQQSLGATRAWAFDLNAACSGFVFGVATADQFIRAGSARKILVVGADVLSPFTDWKDRNSCILFGDGAGAVVVEQADALSKSRLLSSHLGSDGRGADLFQVPAGGSGHPIDAAALEQGLDKMQMRGLEMFKVSVRTMAEYAVLALEKNGLRIEDLDWLIPHQANLRIIEAVAKRLGFPMSRVILNIQHYGNTSAATVPTALDQAVREGRITNGQHVLLDAFGAGLTYGSLLIRW